MLLIPNVKPATLVGNDGLLGAVAACASADCAGLGLAAGPGGGDVSRHVTAARPCIDWAARCCGEGLGDSAGGLSAKFAVGGLFGGSSGGPAQATANMTVSTSHRIDQIISHFQLLARWRGQPVRGYRCPAVRPSLAPAWPLCVLKLRDLIPAGTRCSRAKA